MALGRAPLAEMIADARQRAPAEAVGLLAGHDPRTVSRCVPLPNIAISRGEFLADPFAQWQAMRALREDNLLLVAIYHSHPDGGTHQSPRDLQFARRLKVHQVVIALQARTLRVAAYTVDPAGIPRAIRLIVEPGSPIGSPLADSRSDASR